MSDEWDRQLTPPLFESIFVVSLGAAFKGLEMIQQPQKSTEKLSEDLKEMFSIPEDAEEGLQEQAKAVAAVWMEKSATWIEEFKEIGRKFTEDPVEEQEEPAD
jgi:hypothetical protein